MTQPQILPTHEEKEYYTEERCHIIELFNQPENAGSIAGMVLTTECVISDIPEKDGPAMPGGMPGGMGGMGGMM